MKTKPLSPKRQLQKNINILKRAGLYRPIKIGAPTDYARRIVKRFKDVVEGRAHVVKVPTRAIAKEFEQFRTKANRVVVPTDMYGKPRYSKKEKALVKQRETTSGEKLSLKITPKKINEENEIPTLGKNQAYAVPFQRGGRKVHIVTFSNKEELLTFLKEYDQKYKDIQAHVEILTLKRAA